MSEQWFGSNITDAYQSLFRGDNNITMDRNEYFECICSCEEHLFRVGWFEDDILDNGEPTLYCSLFLHSEWRWYKRIWRAIQYIFGRQSKYGDFDEIILGKDETMRLSSLLNNMRQKYLMNDDTVGQG